MKRRDVDIRFAIIFAVSGGALLASHAYFASMWAFGGAAIFVLLAIFD